jgi:hypothetical protein
MGNRIRKWIIIICAGVAFIAHGLTAESEIWRYVFGFSIGLLVSIALGIEQEKE